jgi:hypothetical protein
MASGDRYVARRPVSGILATSGRIDTARSIPNMFYEGLVVDVIVDHMHPQYSKDGYNVGSIKVRIFSVHNSKDEELLDWADPVDSTIQELPLIGELVVVNKILGKLFYNRKTFLTRRLNENAMLNLNVALNNRPEQTKNKVVSSNEEISKENHKFGEYFKPDSRVRQLKHFEGDVIIQGRMGHSIRFGSSQMDPSSTGMAPNIILRTGQGKDLENTKSTKDSFYGLILEDVNKDASSIWMTSDQTVPFEPTTINAGSFYRSIHNAPQAFDKAQIILNSDRLLLNAKKTHIMLFSNEEIYLNSFKRTSIDSDESIILTANLDIQHKASRNINNLTDEDFTVAAGSDVSILAGEKISLTAKKIHLGGIQNDVEPMVGGTSLSIFLARLIQALMGLGITAPQVPTYQSVGSPVPTTVVPPVIIPGPSTALHVITPNGPGRLSPAIVAALTALYTELVQPNPGSQKPLPFSGAPFNSNDAFVGLSNQDVEPVIVKNEFESGEQVVTENNEWILSDSSYYKVT